MPRSKSDNKSARQKKVSAPEPPIFPSSDLAATLKISPILYQSIAMPSLPPMRAAAPAGEPEEVTTAPEEGIPLPEVSPAEAEEPPRVIQADGDTGYISVLSHRLPEPTSYVGKNVIALEFPGNYFRERPNQSQLLNFDGKTYVDCNNPSQLQGRPGSSLTIEAWIKPQSADGQQHIVTHGQTRGGREERKGAEVFLRIWDGVYEFGAWDGEKVVGVHAGAPTAADVTPPPRPPDPPPHVIFAVAFSVPNTSVAGWRRDSSTGTLIPPDWSYDSNAKKLVPPGWTVDKNTKELRSSGDVPVSARTKLLVRNEDLGVWVHLAGVYDYSGKTYSLYRNGTLLASFKDDLAPMEVQQNWFIGAMKDEDPRVKGMDRFFKGGIAHVRIWTVARRAEQIRRHLVDTAPPATPGEVGAYWPLTDGEGFAAKDLSGRACHARVARTDKGGKPQWDWGTSPIGAVEHLSRRQPDDEVKGAFTFAKENGFFDPLVFPRVQGVMSQAERAKAKAAIKDLELATFQAFYHTGHHLVLRKAFSGETEYSFVPNPPPSVQPRLMLIEEYRLSSFLGKYGVGRTVKSFSLLPGERTKLTIKTSSQTTTTTKESQSILDSFSKESASEFESSLSEEKSNRATSSDELSYHAEVEASGSWGFGSAKASAGVAGSTNSAREDFAKSVSSATSKHAAKASASRNVQINTATEAQKTDSLSSEIVRDIENINVGRTLNFVFCQANQEFITLLHLVDVRIGYTDGIEAAREVPLYELPELLARVMRDNPSEVAEVREAIIGELQTIRTYEGYEVRDFIVKVEDGEAKEKEAKGPKPSARYAVRRDFTQDYGDPKKDGFTVPGIIVSAKSIVMRTEDVVVDALIGEGSALDGYAKLLQDEENRSKRLANDAAQLANELMRAELRRERLMVNLAENKEIELLKACTDAWRAAPSGAPSRVVSIWEPNSKGTATKSVASGATGK